MLTKWALHDHNPVHIDKLMDSTGNAGFVCKVLASRGYDTTEKIDALRAPKEPYKLQNSLSFHGMTDAVSRIQGAIMMGERICVYGDYDCDGVTATTLLVSCLKDLGADVFFYIPNRFSEGYGMNNDAITLLKDKGTELIITVDNGISAAAQVDYALSLGIDVVVTDHHSIPQGPLPSVPTINPHLPQCPSRYKDVAGVGVAFYLCCALTGKTPEEMLKEYGDIVALGSVADVMPLAEDNRAFVIKGLEILKSDNLRPGMKALMEVAGVEQKNVSARTFGFGLGPRINAAGRMSDATDAVHMLLSDDYDFALEKANALDALNVERKSVEAEIMNEIDEILARFPEILNRRVIVVSGQGWHQGVIGIVAARLVERYGKPAVVFATSDGIVAHGSGRSIPEISLIEAITEVGHRLVKFGGHSQAAGLTIKVDKLDAFATEIDLFCYDKYPVAPATSIYVDAELELHELTIGNIKSLSVLEPFGESNPSPLFVITGATVVDFDSLSNGKHTKVHFKKDQKNLSALYFHVAPGDFPYRENDVVDVLVQAEIGEYRGEEQLSVFVRDIKPHQFDAETVVKDFEVYNRHLRGQYWDDCKKELLLPTREDIATAFRFIKERGMTPTSAEMLFISNEGLSYPKTLIVLDVMQELGFLQTNKGNYLLGDVSTKRNLSDSQILKKLTD